MTSAGGRGFILRRSSYGKTGRNIYQMIGGELVLCVYETSIDSRRIRPEGDLGYVG